MRKTGYYRVKFKGYWTIANYNTDKKWRMCGEWKLYEDEAFDSIDETFIDPEPVNSRKKDNYKIGEE